MTYRAFVKNGQITFDEPVSLPEGASVIIEVLDGKIHDGDAFESMLMRHAGKGKDLPTDLATHHDHYAHRKPKP